jgi:hypothetical protein
MKEYLWRNAQRMRIKRNVTVAIHASEKGCVVHAFDTIGAGVNFPRVIFHRLLRRRTIGALNISSGPLVSF